jgi:cobalt/nickel transport system permease protein
MITPNATANLVPNLLSRWEVRHKLIGLLAIIFSFSYVRELTLLPLMIVVSAIIYTLSRLGFAYYWSRIRLPGLFLLMLALILPFGAGSTVLARIGPLALKLEGSLSVLLIVVKFLSIFALVLVLFAGTPLQKLVGALRSLGLPALLAEMLIFTNRYIYQLLADLRQTQVAAGLRGFTGRSVKALKPLAYIVGTLLVRSYNQSERVFQAMTLRGYGEESLVLRVEQVRPLDRLILAVALLLAIGFVFLQLFFFSAL